MDKYYKWLYYSIVSAAAASALVLLGGRFGYIAIALASTCMVIAFILLCRVARMCGGWLAWGGIVFILVSSLFDIGSTLFHSPDLALEGNPLARFLLDNDVSSTSVIVIGGIFQSVFVASVCLFWMAFCANINEYLNRVDSLVATGQSLWFSMYGLMGKGVRVLWGKVDPFIFVNGIAPLLLGIFGYRFYLALEWHGLVPISRLIAPILFVIIAAIAQYLFVRNGVRRLGSGNR